MALNFIVGGISIIIILGLISFITYKVLKKREIGKDPAKTALMVYTVILIIFALMSLPYYEAAVEQHHYEMLQWLETMPAPD